MGFKCITVDLRLAKEHLYNSPNLMLLLLKRDSKYFFVLEHGKLHLPGDHSGFQTITLIFPV